MTREKIYANSLAAIGLATIIFIFIVSGCSAKKDIKAGSIWEVAETTRLDCLPVARGAGIKAPDGYCLTMTINNIEKDILPGIYKGNIVLTVAKG